jgi:phage FluMu gp28-like protein
MNHGWKLYQQAKAEESWFYQVLTVDDTNAIDQATLEEEKRQMPEDLFYQEYYCKFIEGAGRVFRNIDNCIYDDKYEPEQDHRFQINHHRTYRLGVDLAKHQDFTVVTAIDLTTFKCFVAERFNQLDYPLQKARIAAQHFRFNKAEITIDSTGVGEPIYDDLNVQGIPIRPYHFTEVSRRDLLVNLQLLMEQEIIKIPNDPVLLDELRSFQYEISTTSVTGVPKVRMLVPEGLHDDMVMSLALAVWELPNRPIPQKHETNKVVIKEFDYYKRMEQAKPFTGSRYLRR